MECLARQVPQLLVVVGGWVGVGAGGGGPWDTEGQGAGSGLFEA